MSATVPLALGYSVHAFRRATDRWTAAAGLALTSFEAAVLLVLVFDLILLLVSQLEG
jgi:hypothetical protein